MILKHKEEFAMKKWIAFLLVLALLTVSVSAMAEAITQQSDASQEQTQDETDTVTSATQAQQKKQRASQAAGADAEDAQPASGQKDQRGQKSTGKETRKKGQTAQSSNEAQSEPITGKEQKSWMKGVSKRFPFDAFVKEGIISQETADQIKAYLKEKQAAAASEESSAEASEDSMAENSSKSLRQHGKMGKIQVTKELLKELLDAQIITQAEYDAMLPAVEVPVQEDLNL